MGLMSEKSPGSVPLLASPPLMLPQTQLDGLPMRFARPFTWEYAAMMDRSKPSEVLSKLSFNEPVGGTSRKLSEQAYMPPSRTIVLHANLFLYILFIIYLSLNQLRIQG